MLRVAVLLALPLVHWTASMALGQPPSGNESSAASQPAEQPPDSKVADTQMEVPRGSAQSPLRKLRESSPAVVPAPDGSIPGKIIRYSEHLIRKFDRNGDGELREDEITGLPESLRVSDFDRNGVITTDEFARRIIAYGRRRSIQIVSLHSPAEAAPSTENKSPSPALGGQPDQGDSSKRPPGEGAPERQQHVAKRFVVAAKRLPMGLPDWFGQSDDDGDGQVTLAEMTRHASPEIASQFSVYDRDGDGIITAAESIAAASDKGKNQADSPDTASPGPTPTRDTGPLALPAPK